MIQFQLEISNYIRLYEKTAFKNDFVPREGSEPENLHFLFHAFSCWGTSEVQNCYRKQFLPKVLYNYCSKFLSRFKEKEKK